MADEAGKQLAQKYTAGLAKIGGLDKLAGKLTGKASNTLIRVGIPAVAGMIALTLMLTLGLTGSLGALLGVAAGGGDQSEPGPTNTQCALMPTGWCDAMYDAQLSSSGDISVPWSILAGIAKVNADYARRSPYDTIDRDPGRQIAGSFPPGQVGSAGAAAAPAPSGPSVGSAGSTVSVVAQGAMPPQAASKCQVKDPTPAIGGGTGQGVGPFLLNAGQAKTMETAKDGGKDPQSVCDAAQYVASQLAQVAQDVAATGNYADRSNDADTYQQFWETVITNSNLFADPNGSTSDCLVPAGSGADAPTVPYLINAIWSCEISEAGPLYVVSGYDSGAFTTFDTDLAKTTLIHEAEAVAYNYSSDGKATCDEKAALAGVFPLSAQTATTYGAPARCDAQTNIRAAAKAVIAGEKVPVASRTTAAGTYAPMLGGWANIPAALGTDLSRFPVTGPPSSWSPTAACQQAVATYLTAATAATAADGTPNPLDGIDWTAADPDTAAADAWLHAITPDPATSIACSPPDTATFESYLVEALAALAPATSDEQPDATPSTASAPLPAQSPDPAAGVFVVVPSTAATPTSTASPEQTATQLPDPEAAASLAKYFASEQANTPPPAAAVFGTNSMVARLATTSASINPGPVDDGSSATTPTATLVLNYAVTYGGTPDAGWDPENNPAGVLGQAVGGAALGPASGRVQQVIAAAEKYLGTPYSWGGGGRNGPSLGVAQGANTVGFDCSGLVQYAYYAGAGVTLDRTTYYKPGVGQQFDGTEVPSMAQAQPGDLVFIGSPASEHVGIYLGNNQVLQAPHTGDVVKISTMWDDPSYIRRILQDPPASTGSSMSSTTDTSWQSFLPAQGRQYVALFVTAGQKWNVDPRLLAAIAWQESQFHADANSGAGAVGLMQFMPATAQGYHEDPRDPAQAIDMAAQLVRGQYNSFGSLELALAAYNAGAGNVRKYGGIPPFPETESYVPSVLGHCRTLGGCVG